MRAGGIRECPCPVLDASVVTLVVVSVSDSDRGLGANLAFLADFAELRTWSCWLL